MKTVEELTRPRYKVIADYPGTQYSVGEILPIIGTETYMKARSEFLSSYPHLFQPLPWWSDRKPEEIEGLFIKCKNGEVGQIKKHYMTDGGKEAYPYFKFDVADQVGHYYWTMKPELITREEYELLKQQKEKR